MALKPNGKCEKALKRIGAVNKEITDIVKKLQDVEKSLGEIFKNAEKSLQAVLPIR